MSVPAAYDAVLVVSFGGPEKYEDVIPFLENVLRGRNVPRERMLEVAEHYYLFNGKSPINDQCRALIAALRAELMRFGPKLPIYWGNRNWHPLLADTLRDMKEDGIRRALAFTMSAYSSYSSCRQYQENIQQAREAVGPGVPQVEKIRAFYNHPHFLEPMAERVKEALAVIPEHRRAASSIAFTAHSIPSSMAETSQYQQQLREACRLVAELARHPRWTLGYQSRSGPASQPWLEPDINDHLRALSKDGVTDVVVVPIGFISDHMEILYDLDTEASELARNLGINMVRAKTVGTHPTFIRMIRELINERTLQNEPKLAIGQFGPNHDFCPAGCCPAPQRVRA